MAYRDFEKCAWCGVRYERSVLKIEKDLGFICPVCIAAVRSRGETLLIVEGGEIR